MRILLHTDNLNYRGTTVSILDYARWLRREFHYECIIACNKDYHPSPDIKTQPEILKNIRNEFEVRLVRPANIDSVVWDVDVSYFLRSGEKDFLPSCSKAVVHAVFPVLDPHGSVYAYISSWLSEELSGGVIPYVPHMLDLPEPTGNFRKNLGISDEQIVVGRYGGHTTFDIQFVKKKIAELASTDNRFIFLFLNTQPFVNHPNVKYIDPVYDPQIKSNFIDTCDVFVHGRQMGESFGLSVCEPLSFNKPVLCWAGGRDRHHVKLLAGSGLLYDEADFSEKLLAFAERPRNEVSHLVEEFRPLPVIRKFHSVFLS